MASLKDYAGDRTKDVVENYIRKQQIEREEKEAKRLKIMEFDRVQRLAEAARLEQYPGWLRAWADKNYKIKTSAELAGLVKWIYFVLYQAEKHLDGKLTIKKMHKLLRMRKVENRSFRAEIFYQNLGQLLVKQDLATIPQPKIGNVLKPEALQFFKILMEKAG